MRYDPDLCLATEQTIPIDRAVTLLMPWPIDPEQFGFAPAATVVRPVGSPDNDPDSAPGLGRRLLHFISRSS